MIHTTFLSLGSNLGDRRALLCEGINQLVRHPQITLQKVSSLYESEPIEMIDQPTFYNCAIQISHQLPLMKLLEFCQEIETQSGRVRLIDKGPRTLDIDLLISDKLAVRTSRLQLPHPRLAYRQFVLTPLLEIAPYLAHPLNHQPVSALQASEDCRGNLILIEGAFWYAPL